MVFHWSLSDSKSPQVSRTLLRILAVFSNAVIWIVSARPPTSKSFRPFNNHLVIVPKAPITIEIIVTVMFHSFFKSLARSRYISFFSHSFSFILWSAGTAKSTILQVPFFLLMIIRSGLQAEIRWFVCMPKSHRNLCVPFSRTGAELCIYHFFVWSNLNFSHISQWITLPTQSCLVLYSSCAKLLHSLIMWLIVSSLIIIIIIMLVNFYTSVSWWSFNDWNLSDSKFPQDSRTLLSILTDVSNAVVWIVSTRPVISNSSCPCINPLVTVPRAPITMGITVSFIFHNLFSSLARSSYLSFFSISFSFTL